MLTFPPLADIKVQSQPVCIWDSASVKAPEADGKAGDKDC